MPAGKIITVKSDKADFYKQTQHLFKLLASQLACVSFSFFYSYSSSPRVCVVLTSCVSFLLSPIRKKKIKNQVLTNAAVVLPESNPTLTSRTSNSLKCSTLETVWYSGDYKTWNDCVLRQRKETQNLTALFTPRPGSLVKKPNLQVSFIKIPLWSYLDYRPTNNNHFVLKIVLRARGPTRSHPKPVGLAGVSVSQECLRRM